MTSARLLPMSADREEKMRDALEHIAGLDTSQAACAQYIPRHNWQHIYDDQGHRAVCSKCGAVLGRDYICCIPRQ